MADVPLAARMRPTTFEEFVGQSHLIGPGKALSRLLEGGHLPSIVLWGPAGTGKTTLAYLLADAVGAQLVQLSAVSSGVADARKVIDQARGGLFRTVLFVDEVHRWSKAQQDVLLPAVEEGTVTLIGATTENPYFSLVTPLLSRCILLQLEPLSPDEIRTLLEHALADEDRGLAKQGVEVSDEAFDHLVDIAGGDARVALTGLEAAVLAARSAGEGTVTLERAADAVQKKAIVYDRQGDAHYDVISAFIKSIRGSDPDAALFWLARMLEAGEDARYVARRMVVHASEDIGLADPRALMIAVAAAQAVEYVGLPEAQLNLAEAAIYLARAPKSNSVVAALGRAQKDAASADPVPLHLKEPGHPGLKKLGFGKGYKYPHDYPGHRVEQEYLPARFSGNRYYEPSGQGEETEEPPVDDTSGEAHRYDARTRSSHRTGRGTSRGTKGRPAMGLIAALDGGDVALIVLSAFWGLLVLFLCVVLINTFRVLESTKILIDSMREETIPLLREVKGSVERTNRELDRVDVMLEATGEIVGRVGRISGLVEEAVSGPLVKLISVGVGVRKAASRFGGKKVGS